MIERDPLIGRNLGAYQIQLKLGEGGMARVYRAYHARLRRDVAIKIILAQIAGQGDFRARFEREAQLVASLEHPNIVAVYDFGEEGAIPYLVMQYIGGGTLRDQLQDEYPLAPQQAAFYALQMARALHSAHRRGIVHRDVKPQNMLVSAQNRDQLLLSDFGIAKLFDTTQDYTLPETAIGNGNYNRGQTSADQILGTLEYMAPEQINRTEVDARTDVYALGVVLFQMLTGRVPFLSTTTTGLMYQHVHTPPPMVNELNPTVPGILVQITARALAKAPEARFQSAEAMAQALEIALNGVKNEHKTDDLSRSGPIAPPGHDATVSNANGQPFGHGSDIRTAPRMPSYQTPPMPGPPYGQQFSPPIPPGQNTGPTLGNRNIECATTASGRQNIPPVPPATRTRKPISMQIIVAIVVLLVALALLVMRFQTFTGPTTQTTGQPTGPATAFTEMFVNNNAGWTEGSINGLTASVAGKQYTLTTVPKDTFFPYPTKIGSLPKQFTLTAQIRQDKGTTDVFYGIAFYMTAQNGQTQAAYAFVITSNGLYALLRYDNNTSVTLWSGQSTVVRNLHQINTLQATVKDGTFSFKINGQATALKSGTSLKDTTYENGQAGLVVTGPDAQFTATKVQLAIP
ncbi:MAG: protein kinase [Ktedonobacteraceae bacterium]|nr:protein kinase [Ktedonobacteraceae bacterium]